MGGIPYGKGLREWLTLDEEERPMLPLRTSTEYSLFLQRAPPRDHSEWPGLREAAYKVWCRVRCDPRGFV